MRELRKSHSKQLFGVAAGVAAYFEIDRTMVRAIWIVTGVFFPPLILAYLVLALVMPAPIGESDPPIVIVEPNGEESGFHSNTKANRRLTKSNDRWIAGVAGGIALYFDIDPVLVRAIFLASLFLGGLGLLIYLALALLMPKADYQDR